MKCFVYLLLITSELFVPESYHINGKLTGLTDGTKIYLVHQTKVGVNRRPDTVNISISQNSSFHFTGKLKLEGEFYSVRVEGQEKYPIVIFLDNSSVTIDGSIAEIKQVQVTGSQSNKDFEYYKWNIYMPFHLRWERLNLEWQSSLKNMDTKFSETLQTKMESINDSIVMAANDFIMNHPKSLYSAFLIVNHSNAFPLDKRQALYDLLGTNSKNGVYGILAEEKIKEEKLKEKAGMENEN